MKAKKEKYLENRLWRARHALDLRQKHVAFLLGHKSIDAISRYETADRLPGLEVALSLEFVYGIPLRLLFNGLYEQVRLSVKKRIDKDATLRNKLGPKLKNHQCHYDELLDLPDVSFVSLESVRKHISDLLYRHAPMWEKLN